MLETDDVHESIDRIEIGKYTDGMLPSVVPSKPFGAMPMMRNGWPSTSIVFSITVESAPSWPRQ